MLIVILFALESLGKPSFKNIIKYPKNTTQVQTFTLIDLQKRMVLMMHNIVCDFGVVVGRRWCMFACALDVIILNKGDC